MTKAHKGTRASVAVAVVVLASRLMSGQAASPGHAGNPASAAPRTPWGDPDIQGVFTNEEELNVPMERPDRFGGRTVDTIREEELAQVGRESNETRRQGETQNNGFSGLSPQRFDLKPSRAWFVIDPPDGRIPPLTELGRQRSSAYAAQMGAAPTSAESQNLWYRCISLGVPASMMPSVGGAPYRILQSPGFVAIVYERMHEARVVPLDGRPHVATGVTAYMGDARGHWDGDTLVVDTRNIKGQYRVTSAAGPDLHVTERFTPTKSGAIEWRVTIEDQSAWTAPWTFSMPLRRVDESQQPLEEGCHEGNYPLRNMLSGARADDRSTDEATVK